MQDILSDMSEENTIIVVFANSDYDKILQNWLKAIKKINISNYLIVAMDKVLFEQLQEKNIPSILRICDINHGAIWIHRINIIKEILEYGYNVVHSDADAVWLKNPLYDYIYNQPYDIVFSQGTYWPKHIHKEFGFVLCCGFFYLQANKNTLEFINKVAIDVVSSNDDQVSCNDYMLKNNIQWQIPKNNYIKSFQGIDFKCSNQLIVGSSDLLNIAVLPHSKFQRIQDSDRDIYIKHIISEKKENTIIDVLKRNNCWFLKH